MDSYQRDVVGLLSGTATVNAAVLPLLAVLVLLVVALFFVLVWQGGRR